MLITKEQQEALVDKYIKKNHNQDECIGFIDGLNAMLELISKIEQRRIDDHNELQNMSYETKNKIIEAPVVTVDDFYNDEKTLIVHNYINTKGKMVLNKEEASLLLLELYKFVNS